MVFLILTLINFIVITKGSGRIAEVSARFTLDALPGKQMSIDSDLASGLEQLGCEVGWEGTEGCPPFTLKTGGRTGGVVHVSGATSSQYLSSLLLSAPLAEEKMEFRLKGELVSKPYIDMTSEVMSAFGVDIQEEEGTDRKSTRLNSSH